MRWKLLSWITLCILCGGLLLAADTNPAYTNPAEAGPDFPFQGEYVYNKESGDYRCAACGAMLFSADTKFDSGTGWPSFTEPANLANVELHTDTSYGMVRTEVTCKQCGGHLGHVFDDGPAPTGQRYCINSCALDFEPKTT